MKNKIESDKISACAHCGGQAVFVLNEDIDLQKTCRSSSQVLEMEYYLRQDVRIECDTCKMSTRNLVAKVRVDPVLMTTKGNFFETDAVKKLLETWNARSDGAQC